jgi:hypothetical protein
LIPAKVVDTKAMYYKGFKTIRAVLSYEVGGIEYKMTSPHAVRSSIPVAGEVIRIYCLEDKPAKIIEADRMKSWNLAYGLILAFGIIFSFAGIAELLM